MDPVGIAVLSKGEDIANVRFRFESGCVANVTASRISRDTIPQNPRLSGERLPFSGLPKAGRRDVWPSRRAKGKEIVREKVEIQRGEPLKIELASFIECAREGAKPKVSGHEAADALDIALEITRRIEEADPRRKGHPSACMTTLWFVAGEASGDARAAEVMNASCIRSIQMFAFVGAGGPKMQALAAKPFDNWIAEAGVLGLWDVLKHYGYFRRKFFRMLDQIDETRPDAVVLVDYPGFNLRLAKALRRRRFPGKILYYISPQVWAWNRGRIPQMARLLDLMICVFPFEKPMYEASGLHTVFAGHPLLEALASRKDGEWLRDDHLLGLFPGSREREVKRIFPIMVEASRLILKQRPDVRFEAAAASEPHASRMQHMAGDLPDHRSDPERLTT